MIKNILLGILGLVVVGGLVVTYIVYSKISEVQDSLEVMADSPLVPITEEVLEEGGKIVEGQKTDTTALYALHDEYLKIFLEEIKEIIELQEKSDRDVCHQFDAKELTVSHDAISQEFDLLKTTPQSSEAEFAAFLVVLGSVHIQLPLVSTSVTAAKGFCAG